MSNSSHILSEINWDDGFEIPVSNEPNKKLEIEVRSKRELLENSRRDADTHKKRAESLTNHLNNVKQDLLLTISFLTAKKNQHESEKHQRMISDREYGRLKQEIQRLKTSLDDSHESKVRLEDDINTCKDKICDLKDKIDWDQKKLEHWLEESSKQDDNVLTLHKYMKEDDSKLKQLMLTMERLTEETRTSRKTLDAEKTDTLSIQIEVDKTAEDFRKQQADREQLIQQWKNTLDQMKKRDNDIANLDSEIANEIEALKKDKNHLSSRENFFENENQNNLELERKIENRTREAQKLVDLAQNAESERSQINSELETAKFSVERVNNDLETVKATITELDKMHDSKIKKFENLKTQTEKTRENLSYAEGQQLSAEQKAAAAEKLLAHEEAIVKNLMDQVKQAREMQFKREQALKEAKEENVTLTNAVSGEYSAITNLKKRLKQIDAQCLQQEEVLYQQDYQLVNLERRVSKLQGEGLDQDEKEKLELKIKNLTDALENKNDTEKVVTQQLKKLKDEVRRVGREMEKTDTEFLDLQAKIAEMDLQYESSQRELGTLEKENNSALVDDNLLRLGISRLRGTLAERVSSVTDLSQRRLQLNTAIKERKIQINNMKDMINAELKAAESERSILSHDLYERINKIEKIRNRYDQLMILMAPPEEERGPNDNPVQSGSENNSSIASGDGENTQSQAYYVIKAAQEKEELQRYGDKLDQDIKKGEAENEALINTVRVVKAKNKKLHEALSPASPDKTNESKELEKKLKAATEKLKLRKNQYLESQSSISEILKALSVQDNKDEDLKNRLLQVNIDLEAVDKQIIDQKAKKNRADQGIKKIDRSDFSELQNLSLDLKEFRALIIGAGRQLSQIIRPYENIQTAASSLVVQCGLETDLILCHRTGSISSFSKTSSVNSGSNQLSPRTPPKTNTPPQTPGSKNNNKNQIQNNQILPDATPRGVPSTSQSSYRSPKKTHLILDTSRSNNIDPTRNGRPPSVASSKHSFTPRNSTNSISPGRTHLGSLSKKSGSSAPHQSPLISERSGSDLSLTGEKIKRKDQE